MPSFSTFALSPTTHRALARMGITEPTPIQAQSIAPLLSGRDLVGQAVTGSGKTLAFAIPLVERCDPAVAAVQSLILVPTRELATQVLSVIEELTRERNLRTLLLIGGRSLVPQQAALARRPQVVVGTPGRVLDHLRQRTLALDTVRYFVLDEADEMLDQGFGPDVERILSHAPRGRQMALFSATVPSWVHDVAARYLHDPVRVQIPLTEDNRLAIEQVVYDVPQDAKLDVLRTLLDERGSGSVLVFGRTKHGVRKLGRQLTALGYPVTALQGNLSQNARDRVMDDFRSGRLPILVATNVAARGLDVLAVERVINYELPESAELFTHRIGRTGRMGRSGEAITLLSPDDAPKWRQLERTLGRAVSRRAWTFADGRRPAPLPAGLLTETRGSAPGRPAARQRRAMDPNPGGGAPLTDRHPSPARPARADRGGDPSRPWAPAASGERSTRGPRQAWSPARPSHGGGENRQAPAQHSRGDGRERRDRQADAAFTPRRDEGPAPARTPYERPRHRA